ncbi:MAG TPA: MerR family transcriptional regulator [Nitrospiria bacterium]|nr:MerR family transcriptional regulator [Nitrospiria bacterium]
MQLNKHKAAGSKTKIKPKYKTQDICRLFDISKATLFRWEREGLISNVGRDWRNWRLYDDKNVQEIKAIMRRRNAKR